MENNLNRRSFLLTSVKALTGVALVSTPMIAVGKNRASLSVLFTNDWHSRIEPFPMDGGKYQGLGGAAKRAAAIAKIRNENKNVLLLDSGDIFQGTPYFNFFGGELEFKLMTEMGYDAATLGNHDFDNGIDGLVKQMPHAKFPFINCNYDFSSTILKNKIAPYKIFKKGGTRIGVLGVGIELKGLVSDKLYGGIVYNDPIVTANQTAKILKEKERCDLIICLSHLGYEYSNDKVSDITLAKQSENIDLILGGHTHTFLETPVRVINKRDVVVNILQTGWAGINLGKIDYEQDSNLMTSQSKNCLLKIS
ncbi:MAG: metallophosphatase [Flavobacteriales bacterium]|nr:metallophosphatase [Flavobacteriales bacterium]